MKLNTKLTLFLVIGLGTALAVAQVLQFVDQMSRIRSQTAADLKLLEEQAQQNALNVYKSVENSIAGSLERGEMEKFTNLLKQQRQVKGLLEFSLYDRKGLVSHASDAACVGRALPADIKTQLLTKADEKTVQTDTTIEIYKPAVITGDCIRCHTDWPKEGIGGVTYFRFSTEELAMARKNAQTTLAAARRAMLRNSAIVLVVLVVIVFAMAQTLVGRPLKAFFALLKPLQTDSRNLTYRLEVTRTDEIGKLAQTLNTFTTDLDELVGRAQEIGKQVGIEACRQAATVEETSSEVQEIASQTRHNAANAQKANQLMTSVQTQMAQANDVMHGLSDTMAEISQASDKTAGIVKTIDGIASQTNLLALNAAVEAARAGEAGQGFSVVAGAVRKLAMESAEAARHISSLIDDTINKIHKGADIVAATSKQFQTLAEQNNNATRLIDEIAKSSDQQTHAIETVNTALADLDRSTQQNAIKSEELVNAMSAFNTTSSQQQTSADASPQSELPSRQSDDGEEEPPSRRRLVACGAESHGH